MSFSMIAPGNRLAVLTLFLAAASIAAAIGIAFSGDLRLPAAEISAQGTGAGPDPVAVA